MSDNEETPPIPAQTTRMDEDLSNLESLVKFDVSAILPVGLDVDSTERKTKVTKKAKKVVPISPEPIEIKPDGEGNSPHSNWPDKDRPPHSYSDLIEFALRDKGNLAVRDVYKWIIENFDYYRKLDHSKWQPSVRHTLTISRRFKKVNRCRGGYLWGIVSEAERKLAKQKNHWKKVKIAEYQQKTTVKGKRPGSGPDEGEENLPGWPYGRYPGGYPPAFYDKDGRWACRPWPGRWGCPMASKPGNKKEGPWECKRRPLPPWYCYGYPYTPMRHPCMTMSPYSVAHPFFWGSNMDGDDSEDNDEDFGTWGLYPPYEEQTRKQEESNEMEDQSSSTLSACTPGDGMEPGYEQTSGQQASTIEWTHPMFSDYISLSGPPPRSRPPPIPGRHPRTTARCDFSSKAMHKAWSRSAGLYAPANSLSSPHISSTTDTAHGTQAALKTQQTPFLSDVAVGHEGSQEWSSQGDPQENSPAPLPCDLTPQHPPLFAASAHTLLHGLPASPATASSDVASQPECPVSVALMPSMANSPLAFSPPSDNELFIDVPMESPADHRHDLHTPDTIPDHQLKQEEPVIQPKHSSKIQPTSAVSEKCNPSSCYQTRPDSYMGDDDSKPSAMETDIDKNNDAMILHAMVETGAGGDNPLAMHLLAVCTTKPPTKQDNGGSATKSSKKKIKAEPVVSSTTKPVPCSSKLRSALRAIVQNRLQAKPSTEGIQSGPETVDSKKPSKKTSGNENSAQSSGGIHVDSEDTCPSVATPGAVKQEQNPGSTSRRKRLIVLPARYR